MQKIEEQNHLKQRKIQANSSQAFGCCKHDFEPIALLEKHLETYLHVFT